ncbi:MAG: TipAS antibiotic-recognition domain-containing protein [Neisseriaceae bacterium]
MYNNFDFNQWLSNFFDSKELDQYKKIMEGFSPSAWQEYAKQWQDMFKHVEKHLHLDPKSKEAQSLYETWMKLFNKAHGDYPNIREKMWEAYKASVKMNLEYFNQKVIDFIDQVGKFYNNK